MTKQQQQQTISNSYNTRQEELWSSNRRATEDTVAEQSDKLWMTKHQ